MRRSASGGLRTARSRGRCFSRAAWAAAGATVLWGMSAPAMAAEKKSWPPPPPPNPTASVAPIKSFMWLVDGCSISIASLALTAALFDNFTPRGVCGRGCGEMWKNLGKVLSLEEYAARARAAPIDVVETMSRPAASDDDFAAVLPELIGCFDHLPAGGGNCSEYFLVGKLSSGDYWSHDLREVTVDFHVAPPQGAVLAAMVRSNLVEYAACLLRDRSPHWLTQLPGSPIRSLTDVGYTVDAATGEPVTVAETAFRERKDEYRAVIDTSDLPDLLSRIRAFQHVEKANALRDLRVPSTVYSSNDLIDLSSEARIHAAAEVWLSLLARARISATFDDVVDFLHAYADRNGFDEIPCNLREKIYNLDDVRHALRGTAWEREAYCPDEWAALVAAQQY